MARIESPFCLRRVISTSRILGTGDDYLVLVMSVSVYTSSDDGLSGILTSLRKTTDRSLPSGEWVGYRGWKVRWVPKVAGNTSNPS